MIQIKCVDNVNAAGQPIPDGIADIAACAGWNNNGIVGPMNPACTSLAEAIPLNSSQCNCNATNLPITIVQCTIDADCPASPNLCTPNTCVDNVCVQTPVVCPPPADICHEQGTCDPATGTCSNPEIVCDTPPECRINPGTCVLPGGCTYPVAPDGTPCSIGTCQGGICVPPTCGCETAADCAPVVCATASCVGFDPGPPIVLGECQYAPQTDTPTTPFPCGADDVCFNGLCVECNEAADCPGTDACNIATCDANHECQYSHPNCTIEPPSGIKCTIDCCDPNVPGGCVHMPSDDFCTTLDDQCNVGFCGLDGSCDSDPLTGSACGDPATCNTGICVLGGNNRATCQITNTCTAPDVCSTASCDSATGRCSITSECICPEFCDETTGQCVVEDRDCHRDSHDHGHSSSFAAIPIPGTPVPVPVPTPVPALVPTPAIVPATVVPGPAVMTPINNPNGAFQDSANPPSDRVSGSSIKDSQLGSSGKESGSSCATTGTDIKDLWMWMMILAGAYLIRRQKRAVPG